MGLQHKTFSGSSSKKMAKHAYIPSRGEDSATNATITPLRINEPNSSFPRQRSIKPLSWYIDQEALGMTSTNEELSVGDTPKAKGGSNLLDEGVSKHSNTEAGEKTLTNKIYTQKIGIKMQNIDKQS